jgi:hypothetical protein
LRQPSSAASRRPSSRAARTCGESRDLPFAHLVVVDLERVDPRVLVERVLVDPDHHVLAAVDPRLLGRRRLLDQPLGHARSPPPRSCRRVVDFGDQRLGLLDQLAVSAST